MNDSKYHHQSIDLAESVESVQVSFHLDITSSRNERFEVFAELIINILLGICQFINPISIQSQDSDSITNPFTPSLFAHQDMKLVVEIGQGLLGIFQNSVKICLILALDHRAEGH